MPLVADFLRVKKPEVLRETGDRLEKHVYVLVVENGYEKHDRFPVIEAAWPTLAAALPRFLAGENVRLQTVCDALFQPCNFSGRYDESLALNKAAESRAVTAKDFDTAGWRAYQAAHVHYLREQSTEVLAWADRADAHWREAKVGARQRAIAIHLRGMGHELAKDHRAAIASHREALELLRTMDRESEDVAIGLNALANVEADSGDLDSAELHYSEALQIAHALDYHEGIASFTGNLAALALEREDWPGAEVLAREALSLSERLGRLELIANTCQNLATALARQARKEEAILHSRRAVEIYQKLGSSDLANAERILAECESPENGSD